ncbi:protein S100-P-like [Stigmatopora nigra]
MHKQGGPSWPPPPVSRSSADLSKMAKEPTQLESALLALCNVFDKYAKEEGSKRTLSQKEAKTIMEKEMPTLFQIGKDRPEKADFFHDVDLNKNGEMDFMEFMGLVSSLTVLLYEFHGDCSWGS